MTIHELMADIGRAEPLLGWAEGDIKNIVQRAVYEAGPLQLASPREELTIVLRFHPASRSFSLCFVVSE